MQNIVLNMCEKLNYDRFRNDRALGNGKSDNNKSNNKKNNVVVALGEPFPGSKNKNLLKTASVERPQSLL